MFAPDGLILFHGDSITQQNLYTLYLECFLLARFPERRLRFYNAGWKAHRAAEGLDRFDRDVATHGPATVFFMFGSNDAMYKPFEATNLERYRSDLTRMLERTLALGAKPVVMTPPVVDMDQPPPRPRRNEILAEIAEAAAQVAADYKVPLVDVFRATESLQRVAKDADPSFTFLPDGVHPNPVGHLCIAHTILDDLGLLVPTVNAELPPGSLEATVMARIPVPIDPDAAAACALLPIEARMGAWRLRAPGLAPGTYEIFLAGTSAGTATAADLADGIDLARAVPQDLKRCADDLLQLGRERFRYQYQSWREYGTAAELPDPALAKVFAHQAQIAELARHSVSQRRPVQIRLRPL